MIEIIEVAIVGRKPLLQYNPACREEPAAGTRRRAVKHTDAFVEAQKGLYQNEDGGFYHPAWAFWRAMIRGCPNTTINGRAASGILPVAVETAEDRFVLLDPETLDKKKPRRLTGNDWMVDSRAVPIQSGKGSAIVYRPIWKRWGGILLLEVDRELIAAEGDPAIADVLTIGGRFGVGCGRLRKSTTGWTGCGLGKFLATLKR